jgi:ketosteroid isomerase-like protein
VSIKAFADAMVKADLVALGNTYADDYVFTDPAGRVSHKAELLESSSAASSTSARRKSAMFK